MGTVLASLKDLSESQQFIMIPQCNSAFPRITFVFFRIERTFFKFFFSVSYQTEIFLFMYFKKKSIPIFFFLFVFFQIVGLTLWLQQEQGRGVLVPWWKDCKHPAQRCMGPQPGPAAAPRARFGNQPQTLGSVCLGKPERRGNYQTFRAIVDNFQSPLIAWGFLGPRPRLYLCVLNHQAPFG